MRPRTWSLCMASSGAGETECHRLPHGQGKQESEVNRERESELKGKSVPVPSPNLAEAQLYLCPCLGSKSSLKHDSLGLSLDQKSSPQGLS